MFQFFNFPSWISPYVIKGLPIRWYSVMYLIAFSITYFLFRWQCKHGKLNIDKESSLDLFLFTIFGLLLGSRLVSTLLYNGNAYYWTHPWMIFWPFRNGVFIGLPGMSYHGGLIGAVIGSTLYCRKNKLKFLDIADCIIAGIPLGYTFGRIGNFINGELWGRVTPSSFGMVFPDAPPFSISENWVSDIANKLGIDSINGFVNLPRHPSQLYEAFFEGIFLFLILWFIIRPISLKKGYRGFVTGSYILGYGLIRFIIEYFREPDAQLGFIINGGKGSDNPALFGSILNISMGQILCLIMILFGIFIIIKAVRRKIHDN